MSNKAEYLFDEDVAEAILESSNQLIKILDENGNWSGETMNKAHIINTKVDFDAMKYENQIEAPELSQKEQDEIDAKRRELLIKYRPGMKEAITRSVSPSVDI